MRRIGLRFSECSTTRLSIRLFFILSYVLFVHTEIVWQITTAAFYTCLKFPFRVSIRPRLLGTHYLTGQSSSISIVFKAKILPRLECWNGSVDSWMEEESLNYFRPCWTWENPSRRLCDVREKEIYFTPARSMYGIWRPTPTWCVAPATRRLSCSPDGLRCSYLYPGYVCEYHESWRLSTPLSS